MALFCPLHVHPDDDYTFYWDESDENGQVKGEGYNRNWPLPQGMDNAGYLVALDDALRAICHFVSHYLVVSAGFDTVADDPVGGFRLTTEGLDQVGQRIARLDS